MSRCVQGCPLESRPQHQISPGVVADDELVCRAAYGPDMHYTRGGKIRNALIRDKDLEDGALSVWRDTNNTQEGRAAL
jgi:hypothetical protein